MHNKTSQVPHTQQYWFCTTVISCEVLWHFTIFWDCLLIYIDLTLLCVSIYFIPLFRKFKNMKGNWIPLVFISCFRQNKLDEALLSSGRVSDAVQSLHEWLQKAEAYLSEDQPILGDLDTVTILCEQHKVTYLSVLLRFLHRKRKRWPMLKSVYTYRLCVCHRQSFDIMSMVTDHLSDRMGSTPILSVKRSITISTMINFDRRIRSQYTQVVYQLLVIKNI